MEAGGVREKSLCLRASVAITIAGVLSGCSSYRILTVDERERIVEPQKIFRLELTDDSFVDFSTDSSGFGKLRQNDIVGITDDDSLRVIPLNQIRHIYTKEPSATATITNLSLIGVGVGVVFYFVVVRHALF